MIGLSPREKQVMDLLAQGKRDKDIAAVLGISPRTAQKHVGGACNKLGAQTRAEATAIYVRR